MVKPKNTIVYKKREHTWADQELELQAQFKFKLVLKPKLKKTLKLAKLYVKV